MTDTAAGSGCCWPEQEAVWAWMKRHAIELTFEQERDLKDSVSAYRITVQQELERVGKALTAPRVPDGWRDAIGHAIIFVTHYKEVERESAESVLSDLNSLLAAAPAPAVTKIVEYDLSPAMVEGAIRQKLIELGWSPPGAPDRFAQIPLDPSSGKPRVTNEMKSLHIGEYRFSVALGIGVDGEQTEINVTVPWDTCKAIYKGMARTAMATAAPAPDDEPMPMPLFQTTEGEKLAVAEALVNELGDCVAGFMGIVSDSKGVAGYHLNGDVADWDEFEVIDVAAALMSQRDDLRKGGGQ